MDSLYLSTSKNSMLNLKIIEKILDKLTKENKKFIVYSPIKENDIYDNISSQKKYTYDKNQAIKIYNEDVNLFFNEIITTYENLRCDFDFIFVIGTSDFGILSSFELNIKLAKNLNTPFILIADNENDKNTADHYLKNSLKENDFAIVDENYDFNNLYLKKYNFLTTPRFKYELIKKSKLNKKVVVLPESDDERILKAAQILTKNDLVDLILLGDSNEIIKKANELDIELSKIRIINPKNSQYNDEFANTLYEARKAKGISLEQAKELVKDRTYFGTLLIYNNIADAMVSGASTTTAETIRPALQLIKTKEGISSVSGIFFMGLEDQVLAFADCAVNPNPTPEQLAQSAYVSAQTAKAFGLDPKIAMLSYSSGDSGSGASVDLVKEALKIAKEKYPDLMIDGPLQFDAAYDLKTAKSKMPNSKVAGYANVFIFPDLNAANIGYKAVQRTANALAIGPILQGLKKPVNDLSRGCLVDDIVDTVILSAIQAQ